MSTRQSHRHENGLLGRRSWPRPTIVRLTGLFLLLSALLLSRATVGRLVAADEYLDGRLARGLVLMCQGLLAAGGVGCLLWPHRRAWPRWIAVPLLMTAATTALVGTVGTVLWLEVVPPPSLNDLRGLPEHVARDPFMGLGKQKVEQLTKRVSKLGAEGTRSVAGVMLRARLAEALLRRGRINKAIEQLELAYSSALEEQLSTDICNTLGRWLGVAHLRHGETIHCLQMCNRDSCLVPVRDQGIWTNLQPARRASGYFAACLERDSDDQRARWLLNIAHMLAGTYPEKVPREQRLPADAFSSTNGVPRFSNIAAELNVDSFDLVGGAIMDDIDNDGYLDLISSSYQPDQGLVYYHNDGDGTFTNWSSQSHLDQQAGGFNIVQADYNNDDRVDILVLRGAWMGTYGRIRNSLLRQNEDGTFSDVTAAAGLDVRAYPALAAAWCDYDRDGNLDLYIGNEELTPEKHAPSQLFRNNGDGTFTDVSRQAGVRNYRHAKSVGWGDYDNDGDPDLLVANWGGLNRLYRNNDDGTFSDVGGELQVAAHEPDGYTFTSWFWDVNNDGWLDLFMSGYSPLMKVDAAAHSYLGRPASTEALRLLLNDGQGRFRDVSEEMGLNVVRAVMGANFGDIDNDGYLDFYLGTGAPPFEYLIPNVLYRSVNGQRFVDVTASAGMGHLQKGHGVAFGDLDNDGDQDVYAQLGGFFHDDRFYNAMFENPGNENSWISIKLRGTQSNHSAIGARIKIVVAGADGQDQTIHRVVTSGGSFGASSLQQEIGLGRASRIKLLEIAWPNRAQTRQTFTNLDVNQFVEITEGTAEYAVVTRHALRFLEPRPVDLTLQTD